MKTRLSFCTFVALMLAPFATAPRTQEAVDPALGLTVRFSSTGPGNGRGSIVGSLTNTSANRYPCVRIEFDLFARYDPSAGGSSRPAPTTLPVTLRNVAPQSGQRFAAPLRLPARIGLKSVSLCARPDRPIPAPDPVSPAAPSPPASATIPATCTITGRVIGSLAARRCEGSNCSDQSRYARYTLREIWLQKAQHGARVSTATLRMRRVNNDREWWYLLSGVPAGGTYSLGLPAPWRQDPNAAAIACVAGQSHRQDIRVTGLTGS